VKMAEVLRDDIERFPSPFTQWPPNPADICDKNILVPSLLQTFLKVLLSKKN